MGMCTTAPLGMVILSLIFVDFNEIRVVLVWYIHNSKLIWQFYDYFVATAYNFSSPGSWWVQSESLLHNHIQVLQFLSGIVHGSLLHNIIININTDGEKENFS